VLEICEIGEQGVLVVALFMPAKAEQTWASINSSTSLMNSRL
jgi:hypothetical protein